MVLSFFMKAANVPTYEKAGQIAQKAVAYARSIVKKGMPLLELADKIEVKIVELGGKPAFPVNLSIDKIAAHATPRHDSTEVARGLLKVDLGVHIDGYIADTAFSVDVEGSELNKKLIAAAEAGLKAGVSAARAGTTLSALGKAVDEVIAQQGFSAVRNLSGHGIERYDLHAGVTIPNYDNGDERALEEGVYAIEPFATNGAGSVRDGASSGIYQIMREGMVRDRFAREVLAWIAETYATLPFCDRWVHKQFGGRGLVALRQIKDAGLLHEYAQLVEEGAGIVAQAEHTVLVQAKETKVLT